MQSSALMKYFELLRAVPFVRPLVRRCSGPQKQVVEELCVAVHVGVVIGNQD